ncbi:hypothetical protein BDW22DRAFT_1427550 [Trametopsis cervina]|nr:hypothetical protein BDW22DRAFT_1427550 [Trametopsis cervina]
MSRTLRPEREQDTRVDSSLPLLQRPLCVSDESRPTPTTTTSSSSARNNVLAAARADAQRLDPTPLVPDDLVADEFKILRPACAARERLLQWRPASSAPIDDPLTEGDAARISAALGNAWSDSTKATYGAGIKLFMDVCDARQVPDRRRLPASQDLISTFLAHLVGAYSGSAANNYYAGLRAWHIIHRFPWNFDQDQFNALLHVATASAPASSKQSKKQPYSVHSLEQMFTVLDDTAPLDVAVKAAAAVLFYSLGRAGELTTSKQGDFDPHRHPQVSGLRQERDRDGRVVFTLFVPRTKVAVDGETLRWAQQVGPSDPVAAMNLHLRINQPNPEEHIFSYQKSIGAKLTRVSLTKHALLKRLAAAAQTANIPNLTGHAFRVGGTLEYLLRGVPFEVVKTHGRWHSNAFQRYLRKHAQILAPFLQARPEIHVQFVNMIASRARD